MTKNKKKWVKLISFLLVIAMTAGIFGVLAARADIGDKDNELVTVNVDPDSLEDGYIAIGTHLIHIKALSKEIWSIAEQSQAKAQQYNVYYKSEQDPGNWYDVTGGEFLGDIQQGGTYVSKDVIANLGFMYKTDKEGITIDLLTGEIVNIFDLMSPYDLETLDVLEPIRTQYQMINGKSEDNLTDSDEKYLDMMEELFASNIRDSDTDEWDRALKNLDWYKRTCFKNNAKSEWKDATTSVMSQVDATRRYISLENLMGKVEKLQQKASGSTAGEGGGEDEEEEDDDFIVNAAVVDAIGESIELIVQSQNKYGGMMLEDGDNVAGKKRFAFVKELIMNARSSNVAGCDQAITKIVNLDNIAAGTIVDNDSEFTTISAFIIKDTYQAFEGYVSGGLGSFTIEEKANLLAELDSSRAEYEQFLEAMFKRMENSAAQAKTLELINNIPAMRASEKNDEVKDEIDERVLAHKEWLLKEYQKLVEEGGGNDASKLQDELDELLRKKKQCLNDGDMAGANMYDALAKAKQNDIDDLNKDLLNVMNDPNSSQADKAAARGSLNGNSAAKIASDALASMATDKGDGSGDGADKAALQAAANMDPDAVKSLLDEAGKKADDLGLDMKGKGDMSQDAMLALLNGLLGEGGFDKASAADQAAAILALEWFGEQKNYDEAKKLAANLAGQVKAINPYIYNKPEKNLNPSEYITLYSLATMAGYRYVFSEDYSVGSFYTSNNEPYYTFTAGKDEYWMKGDVTKKLKNKALLSHNNIYISEDESTAIFSTKTQYLEKATLGVGYTGAVEEKAKEMLNALLEGGNNG